MKPVRRVYNEPHMPGVIYNFEWKDGVMKSKASDPSGIIKGDLKTVKADLEMFKKLTDDLQKEMKLLGPWLSHTVVYRCRPTIEW